MQELAPIALFTYNRPLHTRMCIEALLSNPEAALTDLHVYSDGWKTDADKAAVLKVRSYLGSIKGFKSVSVTEAPHNRGLAASVIAGVTEMTDRYGKVIAVEDDLLVSPHFLKFMNDALRLYADVPEVGNVHGHLFKMSGLPDTVLIRHADSWGWGTWKRAWDKFEPDGAKLLHQLKERGLCDVFDFGGRYPFSRMLQRQVNGEVDSWAIRWKASLLLNGMLSVQAGKSLVANNGFDETGTNCGGGELIPTEMYNGEVKCVKLDKIEESALARRKFERMYARYYNMCNKMCVAISYKLRRIFSKQI